MSADEAPKLKQFSFNADERRSLITAEWEFPGIAMFAKEAWAFFEKFGGENFVTFDLMPADGPPISITIQRPNAKTPARRIGELESEIKRLKGVLA